MDTGDNKLYANRKAVWFRSLRPPGRRKLTRSNLLTARSMEKLLFHAAAACKPEDVKTKLPKMSSVKLRKSENVAKKISWNCLHSEIERGPLSVDTPTLVDEGVVRYDDDGPSTSGAGGYALVRAVTQPRINSSISDNSSCSNDNTPLSSPMRLLGHQHRLSGDREGLGADRSRAGSLMSTHSAHSCWSIPTNLNYQNRDHDHGIRRSRISSIPRKERPLRHQREEYGSRLSVSPTLPTVRVSAPHNTPPPANKRIFDFTSVMSKPYKVTYEGVSADVRGSAGPNIVIHYDKRVANRKRILQHRHSSVDQLADIIVRRHRKDKDNNTEKQSAQNVVKTPSMLRSNKNGSPNATQKYVRRQPQNDVENQMYIHNRVDKKQMDKLRANMKDLLELFTAVEQDDIGRVRAMLEKDGADVNGENLDDLTLLDVSTMLNHTAVAQLLLKHGAQENPRLSSQSVRLKKIQTLLDGAHTKLAQLRLSAKKGSPSKEMERQLSACESRLHVLKKMKTNFENAVLPQSPRNVSVQVASRTSLLVSMEAPDQSQSVVTRYRVEWSLSSDFCVVDGSLLLKDLRRMEATIPGLETCNMYYVRVSSGNFKGYGQAATAHPAGAVPSSWRDVEERDNKAAGQLKIISDLYQEVKQLRKSAAWERIYAACCEHVSSTSAFKKRKTSLKNLFSASSKFQKVPRKGVYLATVLYKEDKVLCTVDDIIPVIPIDECAEAGAITADYNWLMKVSCAWDDAKFLNYECADMAHASPSLRFRVKFLEAASQMQVALGVQDLGRLHCKPITDSNGTTLLVTIQHVNDIKSAQGLAVKWMPLAKLLRKRSGQSQTQLEKANPALVPQTAMDSLLTSLVDHLNFFESTYIPLDKGLYLCYMKLHASMSDISIVVPENLPSVLPFVYMRHNPHVSREEWDWLRMLSANQGDEVRPSSSQLAFHWSLVSAARILLDDLEISEDDLPLHRLYRIEVVEVHPDVSFILLVPPVADVCSAPNQNSMPINDDKRGCLSLAVPVFEMAHLCTYQPEFIGLYCRLSAFVDFYVVILQQLLRQAFSEGETQACRQHRETLLCFQQRLEDAWKCVRWITDVASMARDKQMQSICGLPLGVLFAYSSPDTICTDSFQTPALPLAGPPLEPGQVDEIVEDNSDVGYHSDQSAENKNGSGGKVVADEQTNVIDQIEPVASTSRASAVPLNSASIDNPTYEYVDSLTGALTATPKRRQASPAGTRVYMNLIPTATSTPIAKAPETGVSYLHASRANKKRLSQASEAACALDNLSPVPAYRTEINVGGSDYINYPSSSSENEGHRGSHQHTPARPPRRTSSETSNRKLVTYSDTELVAPPPLVTRRASKASSIKSSHETEVHEDLSVIDHLYAAVSHKQQMQSSRNFQSSPLLSSPTNTATPAKRLAPAPPTDKPSPLPSGVLRVYAAYPCGLAKGTSVKLLVTPKTSAREMVKIVVQQLNKAVQYKGLTSPFYEDNELDDFCLVAVIGARERCLRDDFAPLELQNPWSRGRLFVRRRDDVLAALEYGNEAKV